MFRFSCIFGYPRPIHSITVHSSQNVVKWNSQACVSKDGFHEDLQKLGASFYQNIICNTQHLFLKKVTEKQSYIPLLPFGIALFLKLNLTQVLLYQPTTFDIIRFMIFSATFLLRFYIHMARLVQ